MHVTLMEAGWRLEMLVEQFVLGAPMGWVGQPVLGGNHERSLMVPPYSRDMNLAWGAAERAGLLDGDRHVLYRCPETLLWKYARPGGPEVAAESAALLLCRAALLAVGIGEVIEEAGVPIPKTADGASRAAG